MNYLFLLLTLTQLSTQLPWPGSSSALVRRAHNFSPYSSSFRRVSSHSSRRLGRRQTEGSGSIINNAYLKYLLPITFGDQTLDAEIDTGSSDTWLIQSGFQCYQTFDRSSESFTGLESPIDCNFGGTYTPDAEFEPIEGVEQLSCYGQTETTLRCVEGPLGITPVTICGLTVPEQTVGAPDQVSDLLENNSH
jgi:hypothetical protein